MGSDNDELLFIPDDETQGQSVAKANLVNSKRTRSLTSSIHSAENPSSEAQKKRRGYATVQGKLFQFTTTRSTKEEGQKKVEDPDDDGDDGRIIDVDRQRTTRAQQGKDPFSFASAENHRSIAIENAAKARSTRSDKPTAAATTTTTKATDTKTPSNNSPQKAVMTKIPDDLEKDSKVEVVISPDRTESSKHTPGTKSESGATKSPFKERNDVTDEVPTIDLDGPRRSAKSKQGKDSFNASIRDSIENARQESLLKEYSPSLAKLKNEADALARKLCEEIDDVRDVYFTRAQDIWARWEKETEIINHQETNGKKQKDTRPEDLGTEDSVICVDEDAKESSPANSDGNSEVEAEKKKKKKNGPHKSHLHHHDKNEPPQQQNFKHDDDADARLRASLDRNRQECGLEITRLRLQHRALYRDLGLQMLAIEETIREKSIHQDSVSDLAVETNHHTTHNRSKDDGKPSEKKNEIEDDDTSSSDEKDSDSDYEDKPSKQHAKNKNSRNKKNRHNNNNNTNNKKNLHNKNREDEKDPVVAVDAGLSAFHPARAIQMIDESPEDQDQNSKDQSKQQTLQPIEISAERVGRAAGNSGKKSRMAELRQVMADDGEDDEVIIEYRGTGHAKPVVVSDDEGHSDRHRNHQHDHHRDHGSRGSHSHPSHQHQANDVKTMSENQVLAEHQKRQRIEELAKIARAVKDDPETYEKILTYQINLTEDLKRILTDVPENLLMEFFNE